MPSSKTVRFGGLLTTLVFIAGILSVALGLCVLIGWHTRVTALIQVLPAFVPMQYNTAVGFILCGAALLAAILGTRRLAIAVGLMAVVIGMLTLGEYIFSVNLGIDELLKKHYLTVKTSHLGRMAPNTAVCFVLIGLAPLFLAMGRRRSYHLAVSIILGSLAFGLSAIAMSGYLMDIETAYGWAQLTRMAIHTAFGFMVLSVGTISMAWHLDLSHDDILPKWLPIPICVGILTMTVCFWQAIEAEARLAAAKGTALHSHSQIADILLFVGIILAVAMAFAIRQWQIAHRRLWEIKKVNRSMANEINFRKQAEETLQAANQQLEASAQQLNASNQQLIASEQQLRANEEELKQAVHNMGERIKELNCLNGLSLLIEQHDITLAEIFQGLVELIPPGWHYPDITAARIIFNDREFKTDNFKKTKWEQSADIKVSGSKAGAVEVYYLKECPILDEGPFFKEERNLIDGICRALGQAIQRKQAEETLRAANQQLVASAQQLKASEQELSLKNEELQSIVYISSHDLKTPLVNITGFSEMLIEHCGEMKELIKKCDTDADTKKEIMARLNEDIPGDLEYISTSTERMKRLIEGLLQVSRIGTIEIETKNINMKDVVSEIIDNVKYKTEDLDAEIAFEDLPDCTGDKGQITQVFTNLIDNALNYLNPERKGRIKITGITENNESIYCVEDNGIGINSAYHGKVFEIYHRLNPRASAEGDGLGLTIVRRILDRHKGRIWFESEPEKGSKFFIAIPTKE